MLSRFPLCALLIFFSATAWAEDWPSFRGPTGMGISGETKLPLEWGGKEGKNVLWKVPLPGTGGKAKTDHNQSSPIVWRDSVFVTLCIWPEGKTQSEIPEQHVVCFQTSDGKQLWDTTVPAGPWKLSDLRGGYCAPTPATDGERVYVLFGSSMLAALDLEGKIVWNKEVPDWQAFDVAIASSPILHRGQLLLLADRNNKKSTLTAFDPKSGEVLWEQKRPGGQFTHTTPVLFEQEGKWQLLVTASNELQGLDAATGERLWWFKTPGDVTSPVAAAGKIFTDSGRGGPGVCVAAGGTGDISATGLQWKIDQIPEGLSSPVIVGDHVYRLHNPGVLRCVALADGQEAYKTRIEGISVPSSPIATPDGRIFFASAGKTFVVQAGPEYKLLATNDLGDPTSSSAAVSGGCMFLKGRQNLFCIGTK